MNALHKYVIQPEGEERRALLAELNLRHEAMVMAKNAARSGIRIYKRHRKVVRELQAKLRGEL
jgi:hypothetical protein